MKRTFRALLAFPVFSVLAAVAAEVPEGAVAEPAVVGAIPVRNPFWPIGYEGDREIISASPRVQIDVKAAVDGGDDTETAAAAAAAAAAKAAAENASSQHWIQARKSLSISSPMTIRGVDGKRRTCVMINGRTYADGDFVSTVNGTRKFFWKVVGLTESGVLKLVRIRSSRIDAEEEPKALKGRKK